MLFFFLFLVCSVITESLDEDKDDWEIEEPLNDLVYGHNDVYCPESEVHLTPLCFTAEVHDVLVNHDIPHKVPFSVLDFFHSY